MKWEEVSEAETPTRGQQVKQVVSGVQEVTCDGPGFPATGGSGEGGGCQSDLLKQPTCLAAAVFGQIKLRWATSRTVIKNRKAHTVETM